MTLAERAKELIFGTDDATNKKNSYELNDPDYKFNSEEVKKGIKELEEQLNLEFNHTKLPWEEE